VDLVPLRPASDEGLQAISNTPAAARRTPPRYPKPHRLLANENIPQTASQRHRTGHPLNRTVFAPMRRTGWQSHESWQAFSRLRLGDRCHSPCAWPTHERPAPETTHFDRPFNVLKTPQQTRANRPHCGRGAPRRGVRSNLLHQSDGAPSIMGRRAPVVLLPPILRRESIPFDMGGAACHPSRSSKSTTPAARRRWKPPAARSSSAGSDPNSVEPGPDGARPGKGSPGDQSPSIREALPSGNSRDSRTRSLVTTWSALRHRPACIRRGISSR
jgi:hypothetical protein